MARVKTTARRRPSDGGRSDCGPSDGGRGSKGNTGDESIGKDVPNCEGNTGDKSVGKDVPTILEKDITDFVIRRPTRSNKNTLAGRDKGPLRTCNNQSIGEAEEEYNPHKRHRVSESTPSKPAGKKKTIVRCRPTTLINLFKKLSTEQKKDVHIIGFGSLFGLKLEEFPRDMIRVLCRNFCPKGFC
ncbi:uncharacterized protein LOC104908598 [Beta vulgaris subsp. vulgaris]|uniref:uncharacterized protein LOC104908598 n=1 Tax=Beta vulgaris subsp. vulgaris TaxID=3555 RepID=UPI00053F3BFD|nr:uncharacterized protein LOC104908598 [Beta vulgaris subsp. vulgaris]